MSTTSVIQAECTSTCVLFIIATLLYFFFFFFQAEDGIRDKLVTGVQTCALPILKKNIEDRKLANVEPVLGTPTDPKLPKNAIDLVLMVDVYHEFSEPATMMRRIQEALKPDGRVVLVEFRKEDPSVPIQPLHKMSVEEVRSELESVGFKFQRSLEFLPWQHVIIFSR